MISKQTLYLTEDRQEVVVEGDPKAKFLLVKAGHEIADSLLEKHEDASKLAQAQPKGGTKTEAAAAPQTAAPKPKARSARK